MWWEKWKSVWGCAERLGERCGGERVVGEVSGGVLGVLSSIWNSRELCGIVYGISVLGYRER